MFICTNCITKNKLTKTSNVVGIDNCELCEKRSNCYDISRKSIAGKLGDKVTTNFFTESVEDIMGDIENRRGLNESWVKIPIKVRHKIMSEWEKILKQNHEKFFQK